MKHRITPQRLPCRLRTWLLCWLLFAVSPWLHAQQNSLVFSQYRGSLGQFIQECVRQKSLAIIDRDIEVKETIRIDGDLVVDGQGHTIKHQLSQLFLLGQGTHQFSHMRIVQQSPLGVAFSTITDPESVWNNTLRFVHISGGRDGYSSSRGGRYNSKQDSVLQWCGTTIEHSTIEVGGGCAVSIFSQDGPTKYLHMRNVTMRTDTTHNIYIHPNVSLQLDSVVSLKAGKLAMHMYSGGNEWMYYTARYVRLHRVSSVGGAMWEMVNPRGKACISITDCDIAPYTTMGVESPLVCASNSRFYNNGNGAMLSGKLTNCRGTAWTAGPKAPALVLEGGQYDEVSLRTGGKLEARNTTIQFVEAGVREEEFDALFDNSTVNQLYDGGKGKGNLRQRKSQVKGQSTRLKKEG